LLSDRLEWLRRGDHRLLLRNGRRGIEKESLRVTSKGRVSLQRHPIGLGSALLHPSITTDYSEALIELVTPPFESNWETVQYLCDLHVFVHRKIDEELLWPMSMPCIVNANEEIPIAEYGNSNIGKLKTIYRRGLGYRYGRAMQAIAGVHFNYSPPERFWPAYRDFVESEDRLASFKSRELMGLVRNYRRNAWITMYLFGASPAFCKSFRPQGHSLVKELNSTTWYAPYATSLRMSDLGYQNKSQGRLNISTNSLDDYVRELTAAITTVEPDYVSIGIRVDDEYRQLNANLLQIENEYYGPIRPKPMKSRKRVVHGLRDDGVEYVEIRTLDLSPPDPIGVNQAQLRVLETLLVYCLLEDSPPISTAEQQQIDARNLLVAQQGRRPGLKIPVDGMERPLADCGTRLMESLGEIAALLDADHENYSDSVRQAGRAFADVSLTPSARLIDDLASSGVGFAEYSLELARRHHDYFLGLAIDTDIIERFERLAAESLRETQMLEAGERVSFESYLKRFEAAL
jgi:glutamate--cysteine ligase